jgi:hypothetical protein
MIHAQAEKSVVLFGPQSVATNATLTAQVDHFGYDYMTVDVLLDSQASTTDIPTVLKISESDDTTTTQTDVAQLTGGTAAGNYTIPNAQTVANVARFNIDLRPRKRYLTLKFTPAVASQLVSAVATLRRAKESPATTALKGQSVAVNA